ncbi:MAG TPA: TetR family transcriptional regulator [Galbitalea sp.]
MWTDAAKLEPASVVARLVGPTATRKNILDAARARFAKDGFTRSTIRSIAGDAGVDASLVMQYFGSKDELFAAVMDSGPNTMSRIAEAFDGPEDSVGERVTRAFLEVWDGEPQESEPLQALLRAAIGNERATSQLRDLIQKRVIVDLGRRVRDDPEMTTRIEVASSMLVGVIVGRRLVGVDALVRQDRDSLVAIIAPAIQALLAGHRVVV